MKNVFSIAAVVVVMLIFSAGYACANDNGGGIVIGPGTGGGTVITDPIGPIQFAKLFSSKSHTVNMHGLKIVYTRETYVYCSNNSLFRRVESIKTYNSKGQLVTETGRERTYDVNGKPLVNDFKLMYNYIYSYNSKGQLVKAIYRNAWYDAKNKYERTETHDVTYTYYSDGAMKTCQDSFVSVDRKGTVLDSYSTLIEYPDSLKNSSGEVIKGDTGAIDRMNVIQSAQAASSQLPQGVSMTGAMAGGSVQAAALQARK